MLYVSALFNICTYIHTTFYRKCGSSFCFESSTSCIQVYIMVKLIFLPKFEQQCARRIANDAVARGLLPMKPIVRIAICQDGRSLAGKSTLQCEAQYFQTLYNDRKYLARSDIAVQCYAFSFGEPPAKLQQHMTELSTTDIFFMTGFSPGQVMSETLEEVFQNHAVAVNNERDKACVVENLFRAIKARVQDNQMVYMGTCGGACCAGRWLWSRLHSGALGPTRREVELFDFCMGASLHYDAGMPAASCDTRVIDCETFQITGGAALAVHIESDIALASSFPCGQNNSWKLWCVEASASHQRVVQQIASQHVSGPCYNPMRNMELMPGQPCDTVGQLKYKLEPLTVSFSATAAAAAAAAAAPAAVPAAAASDLATATMTTNLSCASPVVPAANDGGSWTELLGDNRQLARRSGRGVREAPARAGGQPPPNFPPTGPTRRNDVYFHCRLCNTAHKQLRQCWECNTWACSKCSFWCTHCPKGRHKYNICGGCHATGWYLWKKQAKVWSCRKCW